MEIIGAGFGRTGTSSTFKALTDLGFKCYHMSGLDNRVESGYSYQKVDGKQTEFYITSELLGQIWEKTFEPVPLVSHLSYHVQVGDVFSDLQSDIQIIEVVRLDHTQLWINYFDGDKEPLLNELENRGYQVTLDFPIIAIFDDLMKVFYHISFY